MSLDLEGVLCEAAEMPMKQRQPVQKNVEMASLVSGAGEMRAVLRGTNKTRVLYRAAAACVDGREQKRQTRVRTEEWRTARVETAQD